MKNDTYNGWTNYETWNVKLWMDNDPSACRYYAELVKEAWASARASEFMTRRQQAIYDLSLRLKDEFEDGAPELSGSYADLLNAALSEINWNEIARALFDDENLDLSEEEHE